MTIMQERNMALPPIDPIPPVDLPELPAVFDLPLEQPEQPDHARLIDDYRVLRAAAASINAVLPPKQRELDVVQDEVGAWFIENADTISFGDVHQRMQHLVGYLRTRQMGRVRLFELDATDAFMDIARAREEEPRDTAKLDSAVGNDLLENAPALVYVPEANRSEFVSGLPEELIGNTSVKSDIEPSTTTPEVEVAKPEADIRQAARTEKVRQPTFGLRPSTVEDISQMVEIDMRSFNKVYEGYQLDKETLRTRLTEMFTERHRLLGGKWMPVVTRKDAEGREKVAGFMVACPTNKGPEDFVSWEQITNQGKLDTLFDPNGKNMYIVTLSMDPAYRGERGQDQLYMRQVGNLIAEGINLAFFESRMPGLRAWVHRECRLSGRDMKKLTDSELKDFADTYATLTREVNGKAVPYDSLLRLYSADFACTLRRVVPNAYDDKQSMNFGALYTFDNPLPRWARKSKIAQTLVGGGLRLIAKSTRANNKLMKAIAKLG